MHLPTFNRDAFAYEIALGAVSYVLRFRWNVISNAWHLEICKSDFVPLVTLRLVYGVNLLAQFQHIVSGTLTIDSPIGSNKDAPTRSDFNRDLPIVAFTQ